MYAVKRYIEFNSCFAASDPNSRARDMTPNLSSMSGADGEPLPVRQKDKVDVSVSQETCR